jgi:hypothetical protein
MLRPLSAISRLTDFGGVPLAVVMTFLERAHVVRRSRRDFGSACSLLIARGMPLGDGVKDDLGRERSHLSKLRITNHLLLNSLPLRLQMGFYFLQLSDQPIDFCNRRSPDLLNERSNEPARRHSREGVLGPKLLDLPKREPRLRPIPQPDVLWRERPGPSGRIGGNAQGHANRIGLSPRSPVLL